MHAHAPQHVHFCRTISFGSRNSGIRRRGRRPALQRFEDAYFVSALHEISGRAQAPGPLPTMATRLPVDGAFTGMPTWPVFRS